MTELMEMTGMWQDAEFTCDPKGVPKCTVCAKATMGTGDDGYISKIALMCSSPSKVPRPWWELDSEDVETPASAVETPTADKKRPLSHGCGSTLSIYSALI